METGIPIQAYSKKPNPSKPAEVKAPLAIMLGGVPTIVMIPPQPQAKANGINWREAGSFAAAQIPKATGNKQAAVPVLESTEDNTVPTSIKPNIRLFSPVPQKRTTVLPIF